MKNLVLSGLLVFCALIPVAGQQTEEELKERLNAKKDSISALNDEAKAIQAQIDALPGWKIGAFGTIGMELSSFSNWYAQGIPNNNAGNIGITSNIYANLKREKFFWRNALNLNFSWVQLDDLDDDTDPTGFRQATDVFNLNSLYGRNITRSLAASGMLEYRTTVLSNFNNPGYLDLGVGATWTPLPNLVVVVHPFNYNIVFSDMETIFDSSFGTKVVADYTRKIGAINFKSNLSLFESYKDSNLSNWTWTNHFTYTLWEAIGVGFDFGLRNNRQEALNFEINTLGNTGATFDSIDNDLQSFYRLGLSYSF